MASGIDRHISSEDLDIDLYKTVVKIGSCCVKSEKVSPQEKSKLEEVYRKALHHIETLRRCLEAKIGKLHLRETAGRKDHKDSGMASETSLVISQPTDDTAETGSGLCDSHVLATSMSRASLPLD
ncbi:uncharacterized protein LOC128206333 [Mya arenaria]|uniref:uncharacterized protein LOC128206333 n=1 Tax=Mya arenaria TaxID=6604 RepID=UPI0022DF8E1E|nr:uncharacterized protein LOC128206333 [Mya arenaria]